MSWEENVTGLVQPCPGHTQFSQPLLNPENAKGTQRRLYLGLKNKNVLPLLQGHSTQSSNRDRQASHGKDGLAREICPEEHLTILLKEKKKKKRRAADPIYFLPFKQKNLDNRFNKSGVSSNHRETTLSG